LCGPLRLKFLRSTNSFKNPGKLPARFGFSPSTLRAHNSPTAHPHTEAVTKGPLQHKRPVMTTSQPNFRRYHHHHLAGWYLLPPGWYLPPILEHGSPELAKRIAASKSKQASASMTLLTSTWMKSLDQQEKHWRMPDPRTQLIEASATSREAPKRPSPVP
jgi:hypothetical protein